MKRIALLVVLLFGTTLLNAQGLSGPYVGGYLAAASGEANWDAPANHSISGGLIGVQGGYNWVRQRALLGVQADFGVGSVEGSSRCPNPTFECKTELFSLFTLRGRVGPVFGNVAPYVTGGIASAGVRTSVDNHANSKDDDSAAHAGWIAGLGITGLASRRILWQAEYLHADFGKEEHVMQGLPTQVKVKLDVFRVGVHYKFF